jgi:hypothetical protein
MPISSSFNLRMLPDGARVKFSRLEQAADQSRQMQSFAFNRASEIKRIFSMNASIDQSERRQLETELRDHEETVKSASDNHRAAAVVYTSVRNWVEKITANPPARALEDAPRTRAPLQKGEGLKSCLERLRQEISTVRNAQHTTALAPLPAKDLKLHAAAYVAQMAKTAKPMPMLMRDGQFTVQWFGGGTPTAIPPAAVFAMFCAFDPERAKACIATAIDALPKPTGVQPMSAFDKEQRLRELGVQLDLLERQEEACVLALHSEGSVNVTRRHDASPLALLGIQWVRPTALKTVPRRPATNGNGAHHETEQPKRKRKRGLARRRPKQSREEDRAARH